MGNCFKYYNEIYFLSCLNFYTEFYFPARERLGGNSWRLDKCEPN